MKRTLYFIISGIMLLGMVSCTEFLNEEPVSQKSVDQFFTAPADAWSAVNDLYRTGFPELYNAGSAYMGPTIMYGGYLSGFFDNQYKGQEKFVQDCQNLYIDPVSDNGSLLSVWQNCYTAIAEANTALKYIPTTPGLNANEAGLLTAEAKFFRALNYFHLTKMFGKVPLITEPYESLDNLYVAPADEADIYELVITDLTDALEFDGLADAPMPENDFRISRGSVSALLADVYLNVSGFPVQSNRYAEAASVARSLISNPKYELIENDTVNDISAYTFLRTSDNEKEYLYVVEYDNSIATGGWRPTYCFPNEAATWGEFTYSIACLTYRPVAGLLTVYDNANDLRAQEKQYFHTQYTFTKGPRMGETVTFVDVAPYFWFESDALYSTNASQKDQCHYRLAEMYLIAAEALARTEGVTTEAAGYLADIKARASLNQTREEIVTELMALSVDDFVEEVWKEKIRELIFENKIWNDITRTRMYPAEVAGNFTFVPLVGATNPWGKTFEENDLVLPYPNDEVQRNPLLQ